MFGPPGHAYVYFTYGMHWCLNFVTREAGMPQAVLVRALEPGPGVGRCGGPGLLTRALGIDAALNGAALLPPDLYVVDDGAPKRRVYVTARVGVGQRGLGEVADMHVSDGIVGWHWWTLAELDATDEAIWPPGLADLIRGLTG